MNNYFNVKGPRKKSNKILKWKTAKPKVVKKIIIEEEIKKNENN